MWRGSEVGPCSQEASRIVVLGPLCQQPAAKHSAGHDEPGTHGLGFTFHMHTEQGTQPKVEPVGIKMAKVSW